MDVGPQFVEVVRACEIGIVTRHTLARKRWCADQRKGHAPLAASVCCVAIINVPAKASITKLRIIILHVHSGTVFNDSCQEGPKPSRRPTIAPLKDYMPSDEQVDWTTSNVSSC